MIKKTKIKLFCWGDKENPKKLINKFIYESNNEKLLNIDEIKIDGENYEILKKTFNTDSNEYILYVDRSIQPASVEY